MSDDDQPERRKSSEDFRKAIAAISDDFKSEVNTMMKIHQDKADASMERITTAVGGIHDSQIRMERDVEHISDAVKKLQGEQVEQGKKISEHDSTLGSAMNQNKDQFEMIAKLNQKVAEYHGAEPLKMPPKPENSDSIADLIKGSAPLQVATAIVIVVIVLGIFQVLGQDPSESAGKLLREGAKGAVSP